MVVGAEVRDGLPVPVTVKVYLLAVVPELPDPVKVLCPPQAVRPPNAAINSKRPSIDRQLRRRAGIPRNTRNARTAPPPTLRCGSESHHQPRADAQVVLVVVDAVISSDAASRLPFYGCTMSTILESGSVQAAAPTWVN